MRSAKDAHIDNRPCQQVLMLLAVSPKRCDASQSISSLTLAKRVRSIVLGGAKREVENKEYLKISEAHAKRVGELLARISTLESQLMNALGAAKANADDKTRKTTIEGRRRLEERKMWQDEREKLERDKKEAEEQALLYRAQLVQASAETLSVDPRVPRPPPHRDGAAYPGGRNQNLLHARAGMLNVDEDRSLSVMGSVSNVSMFGADRDETSRVQVGAL